MNILLNLGLAIVGGGGVLASFRRPLLLGFINIHNFLTLLSGDHYFRGVVTF